MNILEGGAAFISLHPDDGGSKLLSNAGILLQHYIA